MSLDYNLTEIKNRSTHFPPDAHGKMNDALHVLIWGTVVVDIGHIGSPEDAAEFFHRYNAWVSLIGPLFNKPNPAWVDGADNTGVEPWFPFRLTLEECQNAQGLRTNVNNSSRKEFNKKLLDAYWSSRPSKETN